MAITCTLEGKCEGRDLRVFRLKNGTGMQMCVLDRGATIRSLIVPDRNGNPTDVVLGHETLEAYEENPGYFGAVIGRCANRIKNGTIKVGNNTFTSGINDGNNSLHGGFRGFDKKFWKAEAFCGTAKEPSITFVTTSEDGEEGYPGNLTVSVTYTLFMDNTLKIQYEASCDKDTVVNLTNHAYFNLGGHNSGTIDDHEIMLKSGFFTPNTSECIPTGEILSVEGRPFDLRKAKKFSKIFKSDDEQIKMFNGFDHNFVLDGGQSMKRFGYIKCEKTGIMMNCYTDMPGVQIYTGNAIEEGSIGKDGCVLGAHHAVCVETQCFPDAMQYSHFPSIFLRCGDTYNKTTMYKFSCRAEREL